MKRYKRIFLLLFFFAGFIYACYNPISFDIVSLSQMKFSNFIITFCLILIVGIGSILLLPFNHLYLAFELFMLGFLVPNSFVNFGFKGILFILFYFIIYKLVPIFFVFLNIFYYRKYLKNIFNYIFKKIRNFHNIKIYYKKLIVCYFLIIFYNLISFVASFFLIPIVSKYLLF